MRKVAFLPDAFEQLNFWMREDRKISKRIADLIRDIDRDPFNGIGKVEPLRGNLAGLWSRRITEEHRLVYSVSEDEILIYSCRFHYSR
jgi:toxin YoeB